MAVQSNLGEEIDYDSEEPGSIDGSNEEPDRTQTFNPEVDFEQLIKLTPRLRFPLVNVFRKTLRQHAIENKYDYYLLHNGKKKVTAYCKDRCAFPWDPKKSKRNCSCLQPLCKFKVITRNLKIEETMFIRAMRLKHTWTVKNFPKCCTQGYNCVGEDVEKVADLAEKAARMGGKLYKCSNCKQYRHNIKRCKNPTLDASSEPKNKGGKPFSDDPWVVHSRAMRVAGKGKRVTTSRQHKLRLERAHPKHQLSQQQGSHSSLVVQFMK
uniref:Transposase MuDR plant domain-containing protein n=1 Tax=Chenopodium quinoa TaxID=63459 RepID=A0A803LFG9_CHEQI